MIIQVDGYYGGVYIIGCLCDSRSAAYIAIIKILQGSMRESLKQKVIDVCDTKIERKGTNVGLSFYAFFANKNEDPELLMEAAKWWILTHKLDHFEKAVKIKKMVESLQ